MELPDLAAIEGFDWDSANVEKNWKKHHVQPGEAEDVFFNDPVFITADNDHSLYEDRFVAFGVTRTERKLFAIFTVRENRIRVISVRDMTAKEKKIYETLKKDS